MAQPELAGSDANPLDNPGLNFHEVVAKDLKTQATSHTNSNQRTEELVRLSDNSRIVRSTLRLPVCCNVPVKPRFQARWVNEKQNDILAANQTYGRSYTPREPPHRRPEDIRCIS